MSRSTKKKISDKLDAQLEQSSVDNVVRTMRFKDFFVNRSLRESGPPRISFPQELPPELLEKWGPALAALTSEEQEQIDLAAHEVRPQFFRKRFRDYAGN